jgi:hypothetical protein
MLLEASDEKCVTASFVKPHTLLVTPSRTREKAGRKSQRVNH